MTNIKVLTLWKMDVVLKSKNLSFQTLKSIIVAFFFVFPCYSVSNYYEWKLHSQEHSHWETQNKT